MVLGPEPFGRPEVLIGGEPTDPPAAIPADPPGKSAKSGSGSSGEPIKGRSLSQIAWTRLKRDRAAVIGAYVVIFLILVSVFAPLIVKWIGHPPNAFNQGPEFLDPFTQVPNGFFGGMSWSHPMGIEPQNGRDIFSEIIYGGRISLLIAFLATVLSVTIGTFMGVIAGYFGGWVDSVVSRTMDVFLAFPLVVFALALVGVIPDNAFGLGGLQLRIVLLVFIIGFFNWPYIGRVIRGQALSLREREFVDAARSLGARGPYIIAKEMLPNLVAPILIYATLLIPTNIIFEAGLSFLGVGIQRQVEGEPGLSWGGMLSDAVRYYTQPNFMFWPGMAIFVTVLAFNLFGDGLRDALDPKNK